MSLFNISKNIFGLDIGDLSFKFVFLKKIGNQVKLKKYGEKIIPAGYFEGGEIKKEKEVVQIIKNLIKEQHISTPYVVAVLPETKTFIKTIAIPQKEKNNIEKIIEKEIESSIPIKIKDVYLDWKIINKHDDKINILVGLSIKSIIDSYVRVLKMAGLRPVSLEIESIAILRSLIKKEECPTQSLAIIDLGATRSSLIIVNQEIIQLTISLPHAGANLTQNIADELKISFEEAQKIKKNFQKDQNNEVVAKNIKIFFNNLTLSLINHLKFYEENSGNKIEKIIVCGGGANLPGLISYFEEKLNIKTTKGNPWVNISEKKLPLPEDELTIYTTAIGLALKGLKEVF